MKQQTKLCVSRLSPSELEFCRRAKEKGWNILKRGWPDFILWKPDGSCQMVEVKRKNHNLRKEQEFVCRLLARHGFKVHCWNPKTGFLRIEAEKPPVK